MPELPPESQSTAQSPNPPIAPTQLSTTPPEPAPPPRSRFRRWSRRLLKFGVILFILFVIGVLGLRTTYRVIGARELAAATAKLDAEESDWRIADITAAREQSRPPDTQNSRLVIAQVLQKIPNEWNLFNARPGQDQEPDESRPLNHRSHPSDLLTGPHELEGRTLTQRELEALLNGEKPVTEIGDIVTSTAEARELGLILRNMPRGFRAIEFPDNPLDVNAEPIQEPRRVVALMRDDAMLAAHANNTPRALQASHAVLNAGRSVGDEPLAISQLVRAACGLIACGTATRVLALNDPKQPLAELTELQRAMLAEADEPILLIAMRGERASFHLVFENINNGKLVAHVLAHGGQVEKRSRTDRLERWLVDGFFHRDHAKFLELSSRAVAVAKLPHYERQEGMRQLEDEVRATTKVWWGLPYWRSRLFMPVVDKLAEATLRHRAALLTTATGIACERFRLTRGRWPDSLEEIPKDVLASIPLDPYTGKPITLTKFKDGIAVCSVGGEKPRRGFGGDKPDTGPLGGSDVGCRLYDPALRGLPPLPRKPKVDPFAPVDPADADKE